MFGAHPVPDAVWSLLCITSFHPHSSVQMILDSSSTDKETEAERHEIPQ